MKFGPIPVERATGSVLAHSQALQDGTLRKGTVLNEADIERLKASGIANVTVAHLDSDDVGEDTAATTIGAQLVAPGLRLGRVFTGRVNLLADAAGIVQIDVDAISAMNRIDEGLTIATLPDLMRVRADQLVATIKIIPYGIPSAVVKQGVAALGNAPFRFYGFRGGIARLIQTTTPGFKDSLLHKGEAIVRARVEALGYALEDVQVVAHEEAAVTAALAGKGADLTLILGASATSDRADVAPSAVIRAGGQITRFGMPVDPGNLLFLGQINDVPVVGLPGCARSPALNGVDWVLERISAGIPVGADEIAAMGVGGLLKEMKDRPQPRRPSK